MMQFWLRSLFILYYAKHLAAQDNDYGDKISLSRENPREPMPQKRMYLGNKVDDTNQHRLTTGIQKSQSDEFEIQSFMTNSENTLCFHAASSRILLLKCDESRNQKWTIDNDGYIRNVELNDLCIKHLNKDSTKNVKLSSCTASSNTLQWILGSDGSIRRKTHLKSLLGVSSLKVNKRVHTIKTLTYENSTKQRWNFSSQYTRPIPDDEAFSIQSEYTHDGTEWCLRAKTKKKITLDVCNGDQDQEWSLTDGGYIKNSRFPKCMKLTSKAVLLSGCNTSFTVPLLFSDGSIRRQNNAKQLVTLRSLSSIGVGVTPKVATNKNFLAKSSQKWSFKVKPPSIWGNKVDNELKWHGYVELAQTHVVKAYGETRHAPKVIAEREAEMLFTPTLDPQPDRPTPSPTVSPTTKIEYIWGLEKHDSTKVEVVTANNSPWPNGYPKSISDLVNDADSEYYIPNETPDVNIKVDLGSVRLIQGIFVKLWYVTTIDGIQIGLHPDDGFEMKDDMKMSSVFDDDSGNWSWMDATMSSAFAYNKEIHTHVPKINARYIKLKIKNGFSGYSQSWGLRSLQIAGYLDGSQALIGGNIEDATMPGEGKPYIPSSDADVRVAGFTPDGELLGVINARSPEKSRSILEQELVDDELAAYSNTAWSATIPWNWVKENVQIKIGSFDPEGINTLLLHTLTLKELAAFSEHTLSRTKVLIFGDEEDVARLDTFTHGAEKLVSGMFNSMPVAQLHWVDSEIWHLPYLVTPTSNGPRLVHNEAERRSVLEQAGDDPGIEPGWDILKNQLALKHNNANTGRGFAITAYGADYSPYASGTSIFMGWALTVQNEGSWDWKSMGYWSGWSAAAWTGWCGMKPGDECGNTLIHEIGHSQTFAHFTSGTAEKWGIADEYPEDGKNLATHPWGYDTTSRRFRTWYKATSPSKGKRDPMNGGEGSNTETCFPQYTAYHAQKSQNWGLQQPLLLSSEFSDVSEGDGAYAFDKRTLKYKKIPDDRILDDVNSKALPPEEVNVPVFTFIGTIGNLDEACQTYPPIRSSAGNTFIFPDPFDKGLHSTYNKAQYFVEIEYQDGSKDKGLIAVKDMTSSSDIRGYSFNIAVSKNPLTVKLYRYSEDKYPFLDETSQKRLLHTRVVTLPAKPLDGIRKTFHAGRGWTGDSGDMIIHNLCPFESRCLQDEKALTWRGNNDDVSFTTNIPHSNSTSSATIFQVPVVRNEDNNTYFIKVFAHRFLELNGRVEYYPLLAPVPSGTRITSLEASYGVKMYVPFTHNDNLSYGTYASAEDAIEVTMEGLRTPVVIRTSIKFELRESQTVDLSPGKTFISEAFKTKNSGAYFVTKDINVGPTSRFWWGNTNAYTTLTVNLFSPCLGNEVVVAKIKAQQKVDSSKWEMNAGRVSTNSDHFLVLSLQDSSVNSWIDDDNLNGCILEAHPIHPVILEARKWHDPNAKSLLGEMVLNFKVFL